MSWELRTLSSFPEVILERMLGTSDLLMFSLIMPEEDNCPYMQLLLTDKRAIVNVVHQ